MTLSFSTTLKGKKTYFVEKILAGLHEREDFEGFSLSKHYDHDLDYLETATPKIHTIRRDPSHRWKPGNKIHFVINNRTKKRFQFVPQLFKVKNVQMIWISRINKEIRVERHTNKEQSWSDSFYWYTLDEAEKALLMMNDGFSDDTSFWNYFNEEYGGVIIHWTDFTY